jgi:hypothetical protein
MSETEPREQSEPIEESGQEDVGGQGQASQDVAPDISSEDQEADQTRHPAPDEDTGVPSDEELSEEGAGEGENPPGE